MRIVTKDFIKAVERLEECVKLELIVNIEHQHFSVYTQGASRDSCQHKLVSATTARGAVDQVWAILNTFSALEIVVECAHRQLQRPATKRPSGKLKSP